MTAKLTATEKRRLEQMVHEDFQNLPGFTVEFPPHSDPLQQVLYQARDAITRLLALQEQEHVIVSIGNWRNYDNIDDLIKVSHNSETAEAQAAYQQVRDNNKNRQLRKAKLVSRIWLGLLDFEQYAVEIEHERQLHKDMPPIVVTYKTGRPKTGRPAKKRTR